MSGVRKTFWTVVASGAGGSSSPRKNGISGCIPAETRSVERSSARGISDAEGRKTCPWDSENARKPARNSAVVRTGSFLRARLSGTAGRGRAFVGRDLVPDLLEGPTYQPRDVHLGDPHLLRDLRLGETLEEAQVQDLALALVEDAEPGREHREVLGDLVARLLGAQRLERVELAFVIRARADRERKRRVRAAALQRLEHLLVRDPGRLGELRDGGRAAVLHR